MSVTEIRMLRWMSCNTLMDRIKNENIQGKLEAAPTEDKMRETHVRWFGHVQRRFTNATGKKTDCFKSYMHFKGKSNTSVNLEIVRKDSTTLKLTDKNTPEETNG